LILLDAALKRTILNFSASILVVEDYLQNEEISIDTETLYIAILTVFPSVVRCRVATSGSMVHREASYVWTMLCDTFGENIIIRTPKYYELTNNDCVKELKRRCRGRSRVYSSTMLRTKLFMPKRHISRLDFGQQTFLERLPKDGSWNKGIENAQHLKFHIYILSVLMCIGRVERECVLPPRSTIWNYCLELAL
jgi:hypothetical protein